MPKISPSYCISWNPIKSWSQHNRNMFFWAVSVCVGAIGLCSIKNASTFSSDGSLHLFPIFSFALQYLISGFSSCSQEKKI